MGCCEGQNGGEGSESHVTGVEEDTQSGTTAGREGFSGCDPARAAEGPSRVKSSLMSY